MRKAHLISAVIFILLSIAALYLSNELPNSRRGMPGPAMWPMVISFSILICAILFFVKTIRNKGGESIKLLEKDNIRVYLTMGILVAYFVAMNIIGFVVSSLVLTFGLFTWYGNISLINRAVFSFIIVGVIYGVFNYALNVPFRFGFIF